MFLKSVENILTDFTYIHAEKGIFKESIQFAPINNIVELNIGVFRDCLNFV